MPPLERPSEPPVASRRGAAALLALGIAFDVAFNGARPGVSVPVYVALLAASLRFGAHDLSPVAAHRGLRCADLLLGTAVFLSLFPAMLAASWLTALDLVVVALLLTLAVAPETAALFDARAMTLAGATFRVWWGAIGVPGFLRAPLAHAFDRLRLERARPALRVLLVAGPPVGLFAILLATADPVFADLLLPSLPRVNVPRALSHLVLTGFGTGLAAVLWRSALRRRDERAAEPTSPEPRFGFPEWAVALGALDALLGAFVVVQAAFLFGGRTRVLVTPGLTFAEYARSGFVQLIIASALALAVILIAWSHGRRTGPAHERWFRGLVTGLVALTGVVLASALMRLALYEDTFGFTVRRLAGYAAIGWVACVFATTLARVWAGRRRGVASLGLAAGLLTLIVVNAINPERFVATRNLARYRATGKIDVAYLGYALGPDAVPVAVALLPGLGEPEASDLRAALCERSERLGHVGGWRSHNGAVEGARTALRRAGITPAACTATASARPSAPRAPRRARSP